MTYRLFVLICLLLAGQLANAQDDRINASLPVIGEKPLWSIEQATGWMKNAQGQWLEGKNKIQDHDVSVDDKAKWNEEENAVGKDNFIKYEVRNMTFSGIEFLLFVKIMNDGYYKYDLTKKGWTPVSRAHFIVFKKGKAATDVSDGDKAATAYETKCYFKGYVPFTPSYLNAIALQISQDDKREPAFKTLGTNANLYIDYKELSDKAKCRFHLYANGVNDRKFDMQPMKARSNREDYIFVFQDYYYECPKDKFAGLLSLVSK